MIQMIVMMNVIAFAVGDFITKGGRGHLEALMVALIAVLLVLLGFGKK